MSEDKKGLPLSMNEWADFWRYTIGVNVIPADTRNKRPIVEWKPYQDKPVPLEIYEYWKRNNMFDKGMAIIAGKIWHNDSKRNLYLILVDLDNQKAIDEFCTRDRVMTPLTELAKSKAVIVEQHRDQPDKAHIMFYATHPFPKKSSDVAALSTRLDKNQIPAIEVKGAGEHGLLFCTPSPHKNGHNYEIFGTTELDTAVDAFEAHIDNICSKYDIPYLNGNGNTTTTTNNLIPIAELDNPDTIIYEGHNRHQELLRKMESVIRKNYTMFSYAEEELKQLANKWNQHHCKPPLDKREFKKQWHDAIKFIQRHHHLQQSSNNENDAKEKEVISVLEAKRKHQGNWRIIGKIVTVSEMYVIEVVSQENEILHRDAKSIQLEDIEKLDENERLDVRLFDDDIANVKAGEIVEITGNVVLVSNNAKKPSIRTVIVNATSIKYVNRRELVVTQNDIAAFEKFCEMEKPIGRLVAMFAPNVIGHDDVKLGVLRSIVGGDDHGQRGGGRVNTFLVGDPGTAKSTIGQEAARIKPNSRHVSAPHASSKTITAIADKENEHVALKLGAIPLARNAICAIDEITAFQPDEQGRLLDVLEEGIIDLDKHGRHWTIPTPTTIIATANPINFTWADSGIISNDEINMIKTLLDRFQQTYVFRDITNEEIISDFVEKMSVISKRRPHNYNFLSKYLTYASSLEVRAITPEAENMLNEFWKAAKLKGTLSIRMYIGLFSIAQAQAKLHLKNVVDEEIANQTMESVQQMMIQYGETVKATTSPKVVTYNKFIEILQNNKVGVAVNELCRIACKEDRQIDLYLGNNWSIAGNSRLQSIVAMLRNHSHIREIKSKPVVLQWIGPISDVSDICDMELGSEELVSVDKREQNTQNQNDFQNEVASHTSHTSDSRNPANQTPKPTRPQTTCSKCGYTDDSFFMNIHIRNCEGIY